MARQLAYYSTNEVVKDTIKINMCDIAKQDRLVLNLDPEGGEEPLMARFRRCIGELMERITLLRAMHGGKKSTCIDPRSPTISLKVMFKGWWTELARHKVNAYLITFTPRMTDPINIEDLTLIKGSVWSSTSGLKGLTLSQGNASVPINPVDVQYGSDKPLENFKIPLLMLIRALNNLERKEQLEDCYRRTAMHFAESVRFKKFFENYSG